MFEQLADINDRLFEMEKQLADPDLLANMDEWRKVNRKYVNLKPIAEAYTAYRTAEDRAEEDRAMLEEDLDEEMEAMLEEDLQDQEKMADQKAEELKYLLVPKDPNDYKNVIVEIRAGAGGEEAGLFAGDLLRMYHMYADKKGYGVEEIDSTPQGIGGYKDVTFMIKGEGAYSNLKYESGVHRVQRVPETESSGRIHTSTATVAVLPEAEEVDVEIKPDDIRVDIYRASGHGGQGVNTTDSAVRLTHLPTGIVVTCQDERSQIKNKAKAMQVLRARIYDQEQEAQRKKESDARRSQVGTGDRSERIRTYNFPQGRITDHRINRTIYQLEDFLDGDIQEMIDALKAEDQEKKLALAKKQQEAAS